MKNHKTIGSGKNAGDSERSHTIKITDEQKAKLLTDYSVWEDEFNSKGELIKSRLVLSRLGELIYNEFDLNFITMWDNSEIYFYNGSYYEPKGENLIKDLTQQFLGEAVKNKIVSEVIGYIKRKPNEKREIFNTPLNLINLRNGIYDIGTGKLLPHSPLFCFLNEIPVDYDPKATCPNCNKFFTEVVYETDIPVIQEFFGYCMYREYLIHRATMFLGGGKNGKSTAIEVLRRLIGSKNTSNKSLQELTYHRFAKSSLYGKMLNAVADMSSQALTETGIFKILTGNDSIDAEKKFKDSFSFTNYAKLIFSANTLPRAEDESYAYFRRWILISFPNVFEGKNCDKDLLKKLTTDTELSGLLNLAIKGLKRLLENGDFSYSKSVDEVYEQYKTLSDPVYAYCQEYLRCVVGKGILKSDLRAHYLKWCKKNKLPTEPANIFTQRLKDNISDMKVGRLGGKGNRKPAYMDIDWAEGKEPTLSTKLTGVET